MSLRFVNQRHSFKTSCSVHNEQFEPSNHDNPRTKGRDRTFFVDDLNNDGYKLFESGKVWLESFPTDLAHGVALVGEWNI